MTNKPKLNDKGQVLFSSPQALADATQERFMNGDASWIGEAKTDYIRRTRTGDASRVPHAEKLLDKIEPELDREGIVWHNDMVGAYPDVAHSSPTIPSACAAACAPRMTARRCGCGSMLARRLKSAGKTFCRAASLRWLWSCS